MAAATNKTGVRRWTRIILSITALLIAGAAIWLVLALQRIPPWYAPVVLDETGINNARRDATSMAARVSDNMVTGQPFHVTLTQRQVNAWLTALPNIAPQIARQIPPSCTGLMAQFQNGTVRLGTHFKHEGWTAILTTRVRVELTQDGREIRLALISAHTGVVQAPRAILDKLINTVLQPEPKRASTRDRGPGRIQNADQLFEGVHLPNRFTWPNGHRDYRIDALTIGDGVITLTIQPLG